MGGYSNAEVSFGEKNIKRKNTKMIFVVCLLLQKLCGRCRGRYDGTCCDQSAPLIKFV